MTEAKKIKICPVCDEKVSQDAKVCPSCSTDLSLFSAEESAGEITDPEELKKSLMSTENGHVAELLQAAENEPLPSAANIPKAGYVEVAECPACNKEIPADALKCPHCGVEFEVEEVFECPMCKTLVDINVNKCPSCGTEFADAPAQPEAAPPAKPAEVPSPPKPEPKREPVSFVDRLKQMKDESPPATAGEPAQPKKELSFAERMKMMKSEKPQEEGAKPTASSPQPAAAQQPPNIAQPSPAAPTVQPKKEASIADRVKSLKEAGAPPEKAAQPPPAAPATARQQATPAPQTGDATKEGYKELPVYIGEVKKLLILANELKIDVSTSKALINKAVAAGKSRDLENAIKLVKEGKAGLEKDIRIAMLSKLRTLETALSLEKKSGKDTASQERAVGEARKCIEVADFEAARDSMNAVEGQLLSVSTSHLSQVELETVSCAINDAEALRLNVSEAKSLYDAAVKANSQNDTQKTSQLSKQATEVLNRVLPSYIASEMRKAKVTLREIKMMNVDISSPVNILKEANDHVLTGNYCAALGSIKKFKDFVDRAQG